MLVLREAREELGITPEVPGKPFFLTVTPTSEVNSHLDVSLWFLLYLAQDTELHPEMGRFAAKLAEEKQTPGGYTSR